MRIRIWRWLTRRKQRVFTARRAGWYQADWSFGPAETERWRELTPAPVPDWPAEMTEPHASARRTVIRQKILAFYADADRPVASALAAAGW